MAETARIPELERLTFFSGQRLGAADLTELLRSQRELRWLHNRALHAWGIGLGLGVRGERGESAVTVEPGYAVDCLGREILLTERRTIPVPAVARAADGSEAVYFLVAKYLEDADQDVAERRPGVCGPAGTVRLAEEPALEWRTASSPEEGFEVVLAQAWIANCQLSRPVSLAARRSARLLQQPYVAAGQTEVGKTNWESWDVGTGTVGILAHVDTSQARFQTTPRYLAHLVGRRIQVRSDNTVISALAFTSVADATPQGFTFQVLLPDMGNPDINPDILRQTNQIPGLMNELGWHVVWMGTEG